MANLTSPVTSSAGASKPRTPQDALDATIELSVVMPCLDEVDTLAVCIKKAQRAMETAGVAGEVVVADNGSHDGSPDVARGLGARVVHVSERGYGNALMGGIAAARGRFVIMGDADDSYDFLEIPRIVERLRAGASLVQGCRLPAGGGHVSPGAMPFLHRWLGNPMFSFLVRRMFRAPINDVYCGLRGFTKKLYKELDLRCTGMEFATEMIIKASQRDVDIAEVPITLHPDGRRQHAPHLRTFRDGWRTLRFFLMCSPRWLFRVPGALLMLFGVTCFALGMPGFTVLGATLDAHTLLIGTLAILLGLQLVQFAWLAETFAVSEGLMPSSPALKRFHQRVTLERGSLVGLASFCVGAVLLGMAVNQWRLVGFGDLDYAHTMRFVIPGMTLAAIGCQTVFASFFLSILQLGRR